MPYVDNRGVRIQYQTQGQGEPLVLIHGWSNEGRYWNEFGYVSRLRDKFKVIVLDLRGHGGSDTPTDRDFGGGAFASDVVAVLDDIQVESAHVFGYSLGGWVVFELASNFPSRVRSAIAGGAHPYEENLSALQGVKPAEIVRAWESLGAPLSPASWKRLADMDRQVLSEIAVDRIDQTARLRTNPTRGLLVCGTKDLRFANARRFSLENTHYAFVPIEGLDHLQTWLRVEQMLPPVVDFLRKTDGSAA
jgi:pimeloyl-ACP methyl ester carboxylesterase